ncbi:NarK/NasA family nitrate transporter [Dietzia cinnamea]|uniref:NarK/NasA family nitrate transporter n=2 Tax=Dietzia TaxID=37914 RepID=A0AAW5Q7Q7_9ACTN|nr:MULTISPECIES: nitrate/nitrite transporter [Dietzia]PWD95014.1 NarK/NasA family nitrate transporter [Dietzia maris]AVM64656.1 NarK/NasA family nitrate transporter [Dietzia sp. oral taxon 368]MBM7230404.1 NarK/NasA family nitrate transporter [Dietzia cinnamea]MCT1640091.1 NarK/NasA family nitrate transporter [Dietzia cinnamea]MCT1712694.1 NarK/NasA family nitrate transporter [Dietzia cinnamea]
MTRSRTIENWDPEDRHQWESGGRRIAVRNLYWSVFAEHVGFSVWTLFAVMVLFMPEDVYGLDAPDKFLVSAVVTLTGAFLRIPYTLATATFGGRNWTMFSAFVLLIPAGAMLWIMANPGQPLWLYLVVGALAGLGGANFASSMTNINAFFPQRMKGWALGLNAGGGNLGVATIQVVGLVVIALAGNRSPHWVIAVYLVLLVIAGIGAALKMDNLAHQTVDVASMKDVVRDKDGWVLSLLYIGTFGSFIGFSFAFGQMLTMTFTGNGQSPGEAALHAAQITFLGPLLGSLTRMLGGRLADRFGGARVTLVTFLGMALTTVALIVTSSMQASNGGRLSGGALVLFFAAFLTLFALTGMGNASVYKMIPTVYEARSRGLDLPEAARAAWSRAHSGALIGVAGAVGAFGGFLINMTLRSSYQSSGSATAAFVVFTVFYVVAAVITRAVYLRRPAAAPAPVATGTSPVGAAGSSRVGTAGAAPGGAEPVPAAR